MEAILEEMETEVSETEEIDPGPESEEEIEEEIVEKEIVEEDGVPKKKPGRIIGLVSGGGRDGVGKFGAVGDVIGGITDRIGVTDYGLAGKSATKKKEKEEEPEGPIASSVGAESPQASLIDWIGEKGRGHECLL